MRERLAGSRPGGPWYVCKQLLQLVSKNDRAFGGRPPAFVLRASELRAGANFGEHFGICQ